MHGQHPLRILWSGRWWLVAAMVAAAVAAYAMSTQMPVRYKGEALAQVIPRAQAAGQSLTTDELLQVTNFYAEFARTSPVERRAERLAETPAGSFRDLVDIEARPDLLVLAFTATAGDAPAAASRANAYAKAFAAYVAEEQTRQRRDALADPQQRVAELQEQLAALPPGDPRAAALTPELQALQTRLADEALAPTDAVRVIQPALVPRDRDAPKPLRNAILAAIAALVLASTALLARHALGDRYASIEEAALDLGLPVLGEVPRAAPDDPRSIEAFRKLRTRLVHSLPSPDRSAILITSPEDGTGKSTTVAGLARALARDGASVVAIDGDLRRPVLHERFDVPRSPGLGDLLVDALTAADVGIQIPLPGTAGRRGGRLGVIPAGRTLADSTEMMSGDRLEDLVQSLLDEADIVLLDSPPVLAIADAAVLSRRAGSVVLVVDLKRSSRRAIRRAVQALRGVDAPLLGLVQNRAKLEDDRGGYGYHATAPADDRERLVG